MHKFSFFLGEKNVYPLTLCTFILFIKGNCLLKYYSWSCLGLHGKESCEFSFAGSSWSIVGKISGRHGFRDRDKVRSSLFKWEA